MKINRRNQRGMSLLPMMAISAVLAAILGMAATSYNGSQQDLVQRKLAATSAVNMAAAELRADGSLDASKQLTIDGVKVQLTSALSADGNTVSISADSSGAVVQATAVRELVQTVASKSSALGGAGSTPAWTVYNSDNVVISKDSINHVAIVQAENAKAEAIRVAAANAEAARIQAAADAANAEAARLQAAAEAAQAAEASRLAQAAEASKLQAVAAEATPAAAGTVEELLRQMLTRIQGIKNGSIKLSGGFVGGFGGIMRPDGSK